MLVPRSVKTIELSTDDIEHILCHVLETILIYEYPTPSIFSALTRLGIVGFLRGKDVQKDIEVVAVDVFRQLSEFSQQNPKYQWFVDWSRKLVETISSRKVE
jgi:hypothetical protein